MNENKNIFLDSGAYTAHTKGKLIDIDKYITFIQQWSHLFFAHFNLDKIGDAEVSYKNWKYLKDAGIETIPVFHIGSDEKWLKRYLNKTDYIGLGAIAGLSSTKRKVGLDWVFKNFFMQGGTATVKVHGLGLTAPAILEDYPWYSVDSFTPVIEGILGGVFLPKITKDGQDFSCLHKFVMSSKRKQTIGGVGYFFAMPKGLMKSYTELLKSHGFEAGVYPQEKIEGKETLCSNWETRVRWNLLMWSKYIESLPFHPFNIEGKKSEKQALVFTGVSTPHIMKELLALKIDLDILISYAYYNNDKHMERIINYKNI